MENLLSSQPIQITFFDTASNLLVSVILGISAAYIYKLTHKEISYSQSYVTSIVLLTVIATMVIMIIGNSLVRAFGLIGAFTIIRFRTAIKDVRDLTFMFFAISLGLAAGVKAYMIAAIGLLVIGLLLIILDKLRFGAVASYDYLVNIVKKTAHTKDEDTLQHKVFKDFLDDSLLLNARPIKNGDELELLYNIRLKKPDQLEIFIKSLSKLKTVSRVEVMSVKNIPDY